MYLSHSVKKHPDFCQGVEELKSMPLLKGDSIPPIYSHMLTTPFQASLDFIKRCYATSLCSNSVSNIFSSTFSLPGKIRFNTTPIIAASAIP